jgi:hypothetical protein
MGMVNTTAQQIIVTMSMIGAMIVRKRKKYAKVLMKWDSTFSRSLLRVARDVDP